MQLHWLWMILMVVLLVVIGNYIGNPLIRMMFWILALAVAVFTVVRLTGIG